jgi:outer membrane protein assembly factor BamA
VFYARGDWTDGQDNMHAAGGLAPVPFFGTGILIGPSTILQQTDDSYYFQKYSAGARWYPTRGVTLDAGGYYKRDEYNYNNLVDSTLNNSFDRYPAYLVMQNFETYDGNFRLTLRPWRNVTLVSRYEYQYSTINTKPDPISGLSEVESSTMTSHILAQDVSWAPWSRLYLQAGFNYVLSETKTPASDVTQAILAAQNNYWTLNFSTGLVLDNRTDLKLGFFYYRANDYTDNSTVGVPYGADAEEYGVTAALTRRISDHLRWSLKYGYSHYRDGAFGGNQDFYAHLVYTSLQYRF